MTGRAPAPAHPVAYAARLTWGLVLLSLPGRVLGVFGAFDDDRARITLRILGARHVVQSVVCGRRPTRATASLAAVADAAHALTAVGLAAVDPHRRRIALIDAAIAAVWAGVDVDVIALG